MSLNCLPATSYQNQIRNDLDQPMLIKQQRTEVVHYSLAKRHFEYPTYLNEISEKNDQTHSIVNSDCLTSTEKEK